MIEPTERLLWLIAASATIGALGFGVPAVGDGAAFALAGVVLLAIVDALAAGSPRALVLTRTLPDLVVEGRAAELVVALTTARRADVEVVQSLPADALADDEPADVPFTLTALPGHAATLVARTTFRRRGRYTLPRVAVRTRGPLGLIVRRARHTLGDAVAVLPDVARIGAQAERFLRGLDPDVGARRRARSEGRELDSLREYQRGDDPRFIEWKASAKRGALITRKMRPEMRQDVLIALDTGRQLAGRHDARDGGEPRIDVAVNVALTLGAAALSRADRVGLVSFAADVGSWLAPTAGRARLRQLAIATLETSAVAEEPDYAAVARFIALRQKRRALVCIITDVLDEPGARGLAACVAQLRGRHVPLVIALGDPALHRLATDASAPGVTRDAASLLLRTRARALAALEAAGAVVIDAPAPRAAALAVHRYAALKAEGRL